MEVLRGSLSDQLGRETPNSFLTGPSLLQLMGEKFQRGIWASHRSSGHILKFLSKKSASLRLKYREGREFMNQRSREGCTSLFPSNRGHPGSPCPQVSSSQLDTIQPTGAPGRPKLSLGRPTSYHGLDEVGHLSPSIMVGSHVARRADSPNTSS